jgi:hypothetical protein
MSPRTTDTLPDSGPSLAARVVLGDARGSTSVDVTGVKVGRRGLVFRFPWALTPGSHAWIELLLPSGKKIRPLVAVLGQAEGGTSARYVHLFPEHRRALDAFLASPSGY